MQRNGTTYWPNWIVALVEVGNNPGISTSKLERRTKLSVGGGWVAVNALSRAGLVRKNKCGRRNKLELTVEGARFALEVMKVNEVLKNAEKL